jgi:aquaporin Z
LKNVNKAQVAPVAAEFLGSAILVMVAIIMTNTTSVSYFVATSMALTLAVIYMFFGPVSGAHVNPGITFGMWTARKVSTIRALAYIAAQLLGALAAWQLFQYFVNKPLTAKTTSFSWPIFVAELIGTAVLALGYSSLLSRAYNAIESALTLGFAAFAGILVAAVAAGTGYINPAVALGVRNFSGVYILGPLVGGLIGVNLYMMLFAPSRAAKKK